MQGSIIFGLSGVKTQQFGLDTVSNNISNMNSNGFRGSNVEFTSVFATSLDYLNSDSVVNSDYENGATVGSNTMDTSEGAYVLADESPFNLAIKGDAWFVVGDTQDGAFDLTQDAATLTQNNYFTRDGSFLLDSEGYLVTEEGYYVYGVDLGKIQDDNTFVPTNNNVADTAALTATNLVPLRLPDNATAMPTATTTADIAVNLSKLENFSAINPSFVDSTGTFDEAAFLAADMNVLHNESDTQLDFRTYPTFSYDVTVGGETTSFTRTYETDFDTVQDFITMFQNDTGLTVTVDGENCLLDIKNVTPEDAEEDVTIQFTSDLTLLSRFGLNDASTTLIANNDSSLIRTEKLKVPTFQTNVDVYDEAGTAYKLITNYVMTDWGVNNNDTWSATSAIYNSTGTFRFTEVPATSTIVFDTDGNPTVSGENTVDLDGNAITFDLSGTEGQSSSNSLFRGNRLITSDVDGSARGTLDGFRISDDGIIYMNFSNGVAEAAGRIGVTDFINDQGLSRVGANLLQMNVQTIDGVTSVVSGEPQVLWDADTALLDTAVIKQGLLETSNVDFSDAMTNLIIMQRAYSASSKAITTGDELLQEAIGLKR